MPPHCCKLSHALYVCSDSQSQGIIVDRKYGPCVQGLFSDDFFGILLFSFFMNHWTFFRILLPEMSPLPSLTARYCKAFFVH